MLSYFREYVNVAYMMKLNTYIFYCSCCAVNIANGGGGGGGQLDGESALP